jgi:protoporphyrinogen oxidase
MAKVAVVGGGPMGLAAVLELQQAGHEVSLYEADSVLGGMTASMDFGGLQIERYYHFICKGDAPYLNLLEKLGIGDKLRWVETRMGYYHQGKVKAWGNPFALLRFSGLDLISKFRYGLLVFLSTHRSNWRKLDNVDAVTWLKAWVGERGYNELWRPLFDLKFFHFTDNLSAAWIWSRMRRVGQSRRNIFTEEMGYLDGGSETLLRAMAQRIEDSGGSIYLDSRVEEVLVEEGHCRGVRVGADVTAFDAVISTIPLPYVPAMIPGLPAKYLAAYEAVDNIAVVCVLAKLKRSVTPYFWLNINDSDIAMPGIIEYSQLNPLPDTLVYLPFYLPFEHPDYQQSDDWFIERSKKYIQQVNPELTDDDILLMRAGRYRYAQVICPPGFLENLPPVQPGVTNLWVADTSYYYPEDRSISESIALGQRLAAELSAKNL